MYLDVVCADAVFTVGCRCLLLCLCFVECSLVELFAVACLPVWIYVFVLSLLLVCVAHECLCFKFDLRFDGWLCFICVCVVVCFVLCWLFAYFDLRVVYGLVIHFCLFTLFGFTLFALICDGWFCFIVGCALVFTWYCLIVLFSGFHLFWFTITWVIFSIMLCGWFGFSVYLLWGLWCCFRFVCLMFCYLFVCRWLI